MGPDTAEHAIDADFARAVTRILTDAGFDTETTQMTMRPLAGGVSSDIALVDIDGTRLCVKRALARLRVAAEWHAPVRRNAAEYEWFIEAGRLAPGCTPRLYGRSESELGFAMEYLPPDDYPLWKHELLEGRVDPDFAATVGTLLGRIHRGSAGDTDIARRFAHHDDFHAIRIEPYLEYTASRHPACAPRIQRMATDLYHRRVALVHGDISPKNILAGPRGPVFLDAECAVYGDPAFDLAFCLNHLLLKMAVRPPCVDALRQSADAMVVAHAAFVDWESGAAFDRRVADLLPALMLARVDGKSPVEYLDAADGGRVRKVALSLLDDPPVKTSDVIAHVAKRLDRLGAST